MVLDKSTSHMKRKLTDHSKGHPAKKKKGSSSDDEYSSDLFFANACKQNGLMLKNGSKQNQLGMDQAKFQRKLLKEIRGKGGDGVHEFVEGFKEYIEDSKRFHRSLLPCVTAPDCDSARGGFQESVVKILLGIDAIQPALMTVLLERLPEFTGEEDCVILEQGQKVNIPHLLLSQFQWLDHIVNSKEVTEKLLEMVSITCEDVQREIISCLPDVVQDSEHTLVAMALKDLMNENQGLTVTILDAMSNLILTPALLSEVRDLVMQSLVSVDLEDLPVLVKFLLQSVTGQDDLQVVAEMRANIEFDLTTAKTGRGNKTKQNNGDASEDVETIILETVKSAVRFQRHVGDALIKAIESVKQPSNQKVIDFFLLLILHGTPRKKIVESLFRNKIRAGCFTEAYVKPIYSVHSQVLKGYFQPLLSLAEVLLRSPELPVSYFGSALYKQTFLTFDAYHQQEIVGNLVAHIGSGFEGEIDTSLDILAYLVNHHLQKMAPFAILVKSVLDYLDNLSVCQIRKLYYMLSALAFKNPQEGGLIQDDLHIVIRKQLSNSDHKYKRMGVIGGVMIVSCIAHRSVTEESSENSCTQEELSDDLYKQVTSLLTLVRSSSSKSPEAYALFMDELSAVVAQGKLLSKVEDWIGENLTQDFENSFVIDIEDDMPTESGNIAVSCQHGLDDESEGGIAINLLPLVVQKYQSRTALTAYTESGVTDPLCLSPSVRLLRMCEERQNGNLENIGALLGCPVFLAKESVYEKFEPLSQREKEIILSSLFYCINWFIEMVNGFSSQSDAETKAKVITRLKNITEFQKILLKCLSDIPTFKPPLANFDLDEKITPAVNIASGSKGETKKKPRKGRKTVGKKVDKPASDSDDNSRDSSQLNNTTLNNTQAATQTQADSEEKKDGKTMVTLSAYKPFFRELDTSVFSVLNTGSIRQALLDSDMNTEDVTELSLGMAEVNFLIEDLCRKLEHSLLASSSNRRSFFKVKAEKKVGFSKLDQLTPLEVATKVVKLLPALCNHLEGASGFFQTLIAENDGVLDGPGSHSPEALVAASCFQQLLNALLSIFSWNGFQMIENRELLKEALCVLVQRIKTSGHSQMSVKELVKTAVKYVGNFANTVPDISTAVALLKLINCLCEKTDDKQLTKTSVPLSEEFLKREWLGADGQREKGSKFNEQLQIIIKSFIVNSEDPLTAIERLASTGIPELLDADKNGCSLTYPTMTKSSYSLYYRVLFRELIEAVKSIPPAKSSDLLDTWMDRLLRWSVAVRILHILVSLVKTFEGRGNLGTCIKYGRHFVEAFLRLGMPLLDHMFKSHRQDISDLLKKMQLSTRALHHMCGHSKIMKDVSLTNNVPMLKRSLEVFVFRVKAMLTVNKCLEAFWIGNLKNRDLQGEEILSQSSMISEAGGDSDGETLPDEDDLSDVELDNESNASNETGENDITDPEGSYSQDY